MSTSRGREIRETDVPNRPGILGGMVMGGGFATGGAAANGLATIR
jgi:hypothetical protein